VKKRFGRKEIGAAAAVSGLVLATALLARTRDRRPVDKTLAGASPALVDGTPRRSFYRGHRLDRAQTVEDLRAMAHRRLPGFALEYLEGGAEDEATLARNLAALSEWHFRHRSFVDVSKVDLSTELFGRRMTMPLAVAPTGLNGLFWPHADLHLAEAAAKAGVPFAQSTMSNDAMERVARVPGLRHWWQLYVFGPPHIRHTLIDRARDAGCEALIVTTDAQIYGNREWDQRATPGLAPPGLNAFAETLRHPAWLAEGLLTHGMPRFENVLDFIPKNRRGFFDSAMWIRGQMDRGLSWKTLGEIRERWPRKLIVKGLLDVADVTRAMAIGADAVAISNHGGRQLDWAVAPLDILQRAREAVGPQFPLIVDGGMRRGTDVLKAVALGADAVFAGRAPLYGLAAGGRAGAGRALTILRDEIERDLGLLGAPSLAELDAALLMRSGPASTVVAPTDHRRRA
jgi:(S)-mandelate dehydrogenase